MVPQEGKRKAAPDTTPVPASTPEKKAVPFADRPFFKKKRPANQGAADKVSHTVLALVGGDMHLTLFTTLNPETDAVRSLVTPNEGVSPFVQKNVYGQVEIPGKPLTVHCKNNFSCIWYVDPDLRCKFEDTLTDNCKSWKDYLEAFAGKYLTAFGGNYEIYMDRWPLSKVLPPNMFSRWFHVKRFDAGDITLNAVHGWVPETDNPSKDSEEAHKYLESGDKMRAEHKERMEALEAGMGSQSSQETIDIM